TQLDHKPAAGRFVELLGAGRQEVFVTVAWGLHKLDVPETLPAVLRHVREELGRRRKHAMLPGREGVHPLLVDHQLSQLNQPLGRRRSVPADGVLRQFIPHPSDNRVGPESRAAAVWALGRIHEGKAESALASALEARLNDISNIPPEMPQVRYT